MTQTTDPRVKIVATSQETSQNGYCVAIRRMPFATSRRALVGLGVMYLPDVTVEACTTRAWRPLRLSRDRHLNSMSEANCSSLVGSAFSSSEPVVLEVCLLGKAVCLKWARVGFRKEKGPPRWWSWSRTASCCWKGSRDGWNDLFRDMLYDTARWFFVSAHINAILQQS